MLEKRQILSVLKKYGYYANNRAPYLYQDQENIGLYFVWPHKHYGNLERVVLLNTLEEAEEVVFQYWWFMNNKDKYPVMVEFDDYETKTPKVSYIYKGNALTIEAMKSFGTEELLVKEPKDTIKKRQLLRTATILILVLKEKIRLQNETYAKVEEMTETLKKLKSEYKGKLDLYKKGIKEEIKTQELLKDNTDESEELLRKLHNELDSLKTIEDIRGFINTLFRYLANIESSISCIQNKYLLNRYPFEIEDMKKKIAIVEEAINEKRKMFQPKQNLLSLLSSVDNLSECNKMVDIKTYIEKEQKEIKEKYDNRMYIDETVLGDYIVSFEKLNITLPPIIENKYYEEFDKEDLYNTLKVLFENLSKKEKSACFVASSFLRECLIILMEKNADTELNSNEVISRLVLDNQIHLFNDAYNTLDDYVNAKIRVKYFSIIKMKTFETFMFSLIEVIQILKGLKQTLNKSFYGYYLDKEKSIINLYLKNIVHLNKKSSYIARFMPNVPIYYSPVSVIRQLDIVNNNELIERQTDTIFLLKDMVRIQETNEKTTVVRYEKENITQEDCVVVNSLKEKSRCSYFENMFYNKEDGDLYE